MAEAINWDEIKRRLAAIDADLQGQGARYVRAQEAAINRRTRRIAEARTAEVDQTRENYLVWEVHGTTWAIPSRHVDSVLPMKALTPLPGAPAHILGVVHYRGYLITVADFSHLLREPPADDHGEVTHLIVTSGAEGLMGLPSSNAPTFSPLTSAQLLPVAAEASPLKGGHLHGRTVEGVIVLDGESLLRDPMWLVEQRYTDAEAGG